MSFAAFIGILMLAPQLSKRFGGESRGGIALVFEALAAYIMTLPLILHSFGTLAVAAPLINVIVMPLVPLAMLLSFVAGLAALTVPLVGGWISWPATVILRFIVGLIERTLKLAPANVVVSARFMIIWYGFMALLIIVLQHRPKPLSTWYNGIKQADEEHVGTLQME